MNNQKHIKEAIHKVNLLEEILIIIIIIFLFSKSFPFHVFYYLIPYYKLT